MTLLVAQFIYRWRRVLTGLIILGAVVLAPRAHIETIDNDLTAWFSEDDPVYRDYVRFRDEFGGTRNLIIAIEAPSRERMFSREVFGFLEKVSGDIEHVQAVQRVSSLATATIVDSLPPSSPDEDGGLRVRRLIEDLERDGPDVVGQRAIDDELLRGDLISQDGTITALIVFFDEARVDQVRAEVLGEIRGLVTSQLPGGFKAHFNGSLEISEWYNRITLSNQTKFTPPILVITMLALFVMFRSVKKTAMTLFAILISLLWTLGLYDLLGFTYNVLSSMIIPLVVVLAVADDVHILQHYGIERRKHSREEAFVGTIRHLMAPLFGASATTALGMLSLATSQVVAVREFGMGSAVGVMVDFAISLVLVPTMLGWVTEDKDAPPQEAWFLGPLRAVARFSTTHARTVMAAVAALILLAGAGMMRLRVDTNHINFFSERHELYTSAKVMDSRLAGIYTFQIFLQGPPDSIQQPDVLKRMDRLEKELATLPFVRKTTSIADYVKRIHRELNDGRPEAYVIPDTSAEIAQELLVFGLGDEGRVELERVAASDFSRAQITIKLASMSSDLVFQQVQEAERLAQDIFSGSPVTATVTGSGRLFSMLDHYLVRSQITSFATAFFTVFGVIFLVFRSWKFGLLSIAPNLLPVMAVFGVMGWLGISLNVATVMVASVALGVVDDDTIHFISRYRRETAGGATTDEAIEIATTEEGRAALTTALINCCAFAVLTLSEYRPSAWFGGLLALTMVMAFLAEVFVLPAMIKLFPRLFGADRVHAPGLARA
ncbi:MAG TPA: MMPL family transporter [Vicinamibacterales bacterium]|nr:MMPL family transporter [Vicinamibacterales bacterium]